MARRPTNNGSEVVARWWNAIRPIAAFVVGAYILLIEGSPSTPKLAVAACCLGVIASDVLLKVLDRYGERRVKP